MLLIYVAYISGIKYNYVTEFGEVCADKYAGTPESEK